MKKVLVLIALVACFVVGYFAGREHVKYQARRMMSEAFSEMAEGLEGLFGKPEGLSSRVIPPKRSEPVRKPPPMGIELLKKSFRKSDFMKGIYEDRLNFKLEFTNKSDKDLRAFTGSVIFRDLFDRKIMSVGLTCEDPLKAGKSTTWEGGIDYNEFIDEHQRLRSIDIKDLQTSFQVKQVIFADGTKETYFE